MGDDDQLAPSEAAALFASHTDQLKRFLWGVLRDAALVQDVLQIAFVRLVEKGHTSNPQKRKAWLFQVAYREALAIRRRQSTGERVVRDLAHQSPTTHHEPDVLVRLETVDRVREAIRELPMAQQEIVRMRIYEEKTFATIAKELGIPLGTALGRMRLAMNKLRESLGAD